jgi:hypothetical protein
LENASVVIRKHIRCKTSFAFLLFYRKEILLFLYSSTISSARKGSLVNESLKAFSSLRLMIPFIGKYFPDTSDAALQLWFEFFPFVSSSPPSPSSSAPSASLPASVSASASTSPLVAGSSRICTSCSV